MKSIRLPDKLEARFGQLRQRWRRVHTLQALLAVFAALGVSYLTVFLFDRGWDTAPWVRAALLASGLAAAGWTVMGWLFRWLLRRPGVRELAVLVQCRYRQLGDRLLGIVELADEAARPAHFSEELYKAAIEQVSADTLHYDFKKAVAVRRLRHLAMASMVLGLIFIAIAGVVPGAAVNAFSRWLAPYRDVPRYALVRIEGLRASGVVVHGEPFEAVAEVRYESFWKPKAVQARFGNERPLEASATAGQLRVQVPGQHDSRVLDVHLGDASAQLLVAPVFRPKLVELRGQAQLPAYLEHPDQELKLSGGVLNVLEGSAVSLRGKISRNLAGAALRWGESGEQALAVNGAAFSSAPLHLTNIYTASLSWRDELGLENPEPWTFAIRHRADQSPSVELPELGFDSVILDTEVLPLRVVARDDFGIHTFGLNWKQNTAPQPAAALLEDEFHDRPLGRSQTELDATFYFSPAIFQISAGTTMEFRAFATDFYPGRAPVETAAYQIHIVSSVEHAEWIRSRLESLLNHLEEISRLQEKLTAATANLRENPDLEPAAIENSLQDQLDDQATNAAQLSQIAQQGFQTLREALRNTRFTDTMMQQWNETLTHMESLAQQKMAQASQSLRSAQQSPAGRAQNLADAQQTQEEIQQELAALQSEANEDLDSMEAMTLSERLRAIGEEETEIEKTLMQQAVEIIGLFPNELAPRFQASNEQLSETQTEASQKTTTIQKEISRFFERTQQEAYGQVSEAMQKSNAAEQLLAVRRLIQSNRVAQATEDLAAWAGRFDEWAKLLNPESSEDSAGGSGEGSGEGGIDLTKQLMTLLRLRKSELTLRVQTRLLHEKQTDPGHLPAQTAQLAETQTDIQKRLNDLALDNPLPDIAGVLQEAHLQMEEVIQLLRQNQTGEKTIAGETSAIHTLTDAINLINEQARRENAASTSIAQQITMMMQMAAIGQSQSPASQPSDSGSRAGGDTDQTPETPNGNLAGNPDNPRSISRSSGQTDNLPTEFRRAFEHYFRQLEQLQTAPPFATH